MSGSGIGRRRFLRSAAGVAAAMGLKAAPAQRPNVVLVITDDQGYGDLGCHGNPALKTPHLDALHSRSVRFTNFHVSPTCSPTRSSLLTGRYSNATGAWHTIRGRNMIAHDEVTLADCFRRAGYRTGIFGKWHLGDNYPCRPQDRGFDEVLIHGGGGVWQTPDFFGNDYHDDTYFHNGRPRRFEGYCTNVWFDNAVPFMDDASRRKTPFFCYLPTNAPHSPMWAMEADEAPYRGVKGLREPGFYGMIKNIDDNVGWLVEYLRRRGLEEDTLLLFMTDNGGDPISQVFNAGMRGQKGSMYDGGHRVPFFAYWPGGGIEGGRDIDTLAAHIDVLPTLTELCGLKRPAGPPLHGRSLKPLLYEEKPNWPNRAIVVDSQRQENLVKWRQASVMTRQWRLVSPTPDGRTNALELYDVTKDPGQKQNVAAGHPEVVERLSREYDAWWEATSQRDREFVRIVLGSERENPSTLTCHDWHGENGADLCWNQRGVRQGVVADGFWAVDVQRAGLYRIELRRWPKEVGAHICAPYQDIRPNRETTPGKALPIIRARVRIGDVDRTEDVVAERDRSASFVVRLPKGPAQLQTWFYEKDGTERGAYYAYVERMG